MTRGEVADLDVNRIVDANATSLVGGCIFVAVAWAFRSSAAMARTLPDSSPMSGTKPPEGRPSLTNASETLKNVPNAVSAWTCLCR